MKPIQDQACPLCNSAAEFKFKDNEHWKHFVCPICTDYNLSVRAEERLQKLSPSALASQLKEQYSVRAKDVPQHMVFELYTEPGPTGVSELRDRTVLRS